MDKFVTWSDNPGLVLNYIDATSLPEGKLAQQFTLCDKFFHSAYGGSLNHQWMIAAASPLWTTPIPTGFQSSWDPTTRTLNDANLTIDGQYAVNTTQPLLAPFSPGTANAKRLLINNTDPSHPGYLPNIGNRLEDAGIDWHVADLVSAVQQSKLWKDTAIIITYDENGGRWDHVVPPARPDGWGVGSRVPGIIISPFSKAGMIDGNEYETVSILKLIERRFHLDPLSARDANPAVSDLTTAFHFNNGDN